jgi:hypothetical protein
MKYFTRKLLAKCASRDEEIADAAAARWENATATYRARLKAIRRQLPIEVRSFCDRFTLHDAKIILTGSHKNIPLFTILLQLEGVPSQPGDAIQLVYSTVAKPRVGKAPASGREWILYDEFDLAAKGKGFTHSLLLSDGSEMQIPFQRFGFQKIDLGRLSEAARLQLPSAVSALRGSA